VGGIGKKKQQIKKKKTKRFGERFKGTLSRGKKKRGKLRGKINPGGGGGWQKNGLGSTVFGSQKTTLGGGGGGGAVNSRRTSQQNSTGKLFSRRTKARNWKKRQKNFWTFLCGQGISWGRENQGGGGKKRRGGESDCRPEGGRARGRKRSLRP